RPAKPEDAVPAIRRWLFRTFDRTVRAMDCPRRMRRKSLRSSRRRRCSNPSRRGSRSGTSSSALLSLRPPLQSLQPLLYLGHLWTELVIAIFPKLEEARVMEDCLVSVAELLVDFRAPQLRRSKIHPVVEHRLLERGVPGQRVLVATHGTQQFRAQI